MCLEVGEQGAERHVMRVRREIVKQRETMDMF